MPHEGQRPSPHIEGIRPELIDLPASYRLFDLLTLDTLLAESDCSSALIVNLSLLSAFGRAISRPAFCSVRRLEA